MKKLELLKIAMRVARKRHAHHRENARRRRQIERGILKVTAP